MIGSCTNLADMYGHGLALGTAGGLLLALFAAVFAILGLTPSLSWIPEVPLLAAAVIVPVAIMVVTGHNAYARTLDVVAAMLAGSLAGALGGLTGGVSYVVAGRSAVRLPRGEGATGQPLARVDLGPRMMRLRFDPRAESMSVIAGESANDKAKRRADQALPAAYHTCVRALSGTTPVRSMPLSWMTQSTATSWRPRSYGSSARCQVHELRRQFVRWSSGRNEVRRRTGGRLASGYGGQEVKNTPARSPDAAISCLVRDRPPGSQCKSS